MLLLFFSWTNMGFFFITCNRERTSSPYPHMILEWSFLDPYDSGLNKMPNTNLSTKNWWRDGLCVVEGAYDPSSNQLQRVYLYAKHDCEETKWWKIRVWIRFKEIKSLAFYSTFAVGWGDPQGDQEPTLDLKSSRLNLLAWFCVKQGTHFCQKIAVWRMGRVMVGMGTKAHFAPPPRSPSITKIKILARLQSKRQRCDQILAKR